MCCPAVAEPNTRLPFVAGGAHAMSDASVAVRSVPSPRRTKVTSPGWANESPFSPNVQSRSNVKLNVAFEARLSPNRPETVPPCQLAVSV